MTMLLRGMRLDSEEAKEAVRKGEMNRPSRKYTLMLLDESVRVAREVGPAEASRQTGVGVESIKKHARRANIAAGIAPTQSGPSRKYSDEIKRKVVADALRYNHFTKDKWAECFARAAMNNGLDAKAGRSIEVQYRQGTLTL